MTKNKYLVGFVLLFAFGAFYQLVARAMVVKAVLPPNARFSSFVSTLVNPPYQIAAPHLSVSKVVHNFLFRTVEACGGTNPPCNGQTASLYCGEDGECQNGFCYCPGCQQVPGCTVKKCKQITVGKIYCESDNTTPPCEYCDYASNGKCTQ